MSRPPPPADQPLDLPPPQRGGWRYALAFPNRKAVGAANLGFQAVHGLLAALPGAQCRRAFADAADGDLGSADAVAFSLSFEGDYPAALGMLAAAGLPLRTAERTRGHPLVLAGGVGPTLNPEPLAPFVDAFLLGEAEAALPLLHAFLADRRGQDRGELLAALADARLPGVYVPSRYEVEEAGGAVVARRPLGDAPVRVDRQWAPCPWDPARTRVRTPDDAFGGAYLLEVSRGCPHGCRFCAAGHLTRPTRFLPREVLAPWIALGARAAGKLGLVGAAVSDHPDFAALGEAALAAGAAFTVSSFRAENLDPARLALLVRGGLRTLTVALEAGTEPLRRFLGKGLGEEDLLRAAGLAGEAGLRALRVYAMVGLPGEADADVEALAEVAGRAHRALGSGQVTLSAAPFVPKPQTPLQGEAMASEGVLKRRLRLLVARGARQDGVQVAVEPARAARVQGLLSRGGRAVAPLLEAVARGGDWRGALRSPVAAAVLDHPRDPGERFPWSFVSGAPAPAYLAAEAAAARTGRPPHPCRPGPCRACGVCGSPQDPTQG